MADFNVFVAKDEIMYCSSCPGGGLVKPDIVFFDEAFPKSFSEKFPKISKCDLVFVMGTILTVKPFASLIDMVGT